MMKNMHIFRIAGEAQLEIQKSAGAILWNLIIHPLVVVFFSRLMEMFPVSMFGKIFDF